MSRAGTRALGWTLALLVIAGFVHLGLWQQHRAVEKQAMLDAAAQVLQTRHAMPLAAANDPARRHGYDWSAGEGEFDQRGPLWLDNQQREGRPGVRAYRVFIPDHGQPLLIDLGWLPLPGNRALPAIQCPVGRIAVRGLLTPPPSTGIPLGSGVMRQGDGWLLTRVDIDKLGANLGLSTPLAPRVLRLDPALPLGYPRDLELLANTLTPATHRGYAVQWFALALTVLITALLLTFRKGLR